MEVYAKIRDYFKKLRIFQSVKDLFWGLSDGFWGVVRIWRVWKENENVVAFFAKNNAGVVSHIAKFAGFMSNFYVLRQVFGDSVIDGLV